jgi:murein DD-endopeptidase MepM/ murein hydrolase activator NlpD
VKKRDILSQRPRAAGLVRQAILASALLLLPTLGVLTAFGIAPGTATRQEEQVLVRQALDLPQLEPVAATTPERFPAQERVQRGDTAAALFERLGIRDEQAMAFLRTDPIGRSLVRQLVPGRMIQAETDGEGAMHSLLYFLGPSALLEVKREGASFTARQRGMTDEPRTYYKTASIQSSLFAATDAAGVPDAIAIQLARVFSTDIDFHADLRRGDRFSVVYDMHYEGGELVAPGRILAAQFVNDGHVYNAVLFRDEDGTEAYYSLDGSSRAKAFLRSPVEFSRISSGFGGRVHPIFRNWRAHTGVDFAAPRGTRVIAAADGQVMTAGTKGGYGNAIEIRHGGAVSTLYGHLSGFAAGIRAGTRVRQGEVIGFVGSTGFATGPHLHYEFKIAGVHQDPMRVALPKAEPVPARLQAQFRQVSETAQATIARVSVASSARFE